MRGAYDLCPSPKIKEKKMNKIRKFKTGATRDTDENKLDYEGFLSPLVLERYAEYMHENRIQPDGKLRSSDNWQKGIPKDAYIKSLFRHFMDLWKEHRGLPSREGIEDALCGIIFNSMGYLYEELRNPKNQGKDDIASCPSIFTPDESTTFSPYTTTIDSPHSTTTYDSSKFTTTNDPSKFTTTNISNEKTN